MASNPDPLAIAVLAYPRSGSTYLARLLGYLLDCPIRDLPGEKSYAAEERPDNGFVVHQTHNRRAIPLHLEHPLDGSTGRSASSVEPLAEVRLGERPSQAKVIHLIRDPRDIAVSMFYYWKLEKLDDAIACVVSDNVPPVYLANWGSFIESGTAISHLQVRYVDLLKYPFSTLARVFSELRLEMPEMGAIEEALIRMAVPTILENSRPVNYPHPMHEHSIRKGAPGDWRAHFSVEQNQRVLHALGETMRAFGYTESFDPEEYVPFWRANDRR